MASARPMWPTPSPVLALTLTAAASRPSSSARCRRVSGKRPDRNGTSIAGRRRGGQRESGRSAVVAEGRLDGEVLEAHELLEVGELDLAGRAVALLGDDDLDDALVLAGFVELGA